MNEFRYHYGPTATDPDLGKMWHYDCGGEVMIIDEAPICFLCKAQGEQEVIEEAPVRLCCSQRHWGPMCADLHIMCVICFDRFPVSKTTVDDVCPYCHAMEKL